MKKPLSQELNPWKSILLFLLTGLLAANANAKNIYLSPTGNDVSDGLTPETAVASITQAFTLLANGDTIRVKGMIDLTQTPGFLTDGNSFTVPSATMGWTTGFAIVGDDRQTCGFFCNKQGRFGNQIAGYNNATVKILFKNLLFKDCGRASLGGGSVLRVVNNSGLIQVIDCDFTGSAGSQGSICCYNSNMKVSGCKFWENNVQLGGAVYFNDDNNATSPRTVEIENCLIENNQPDYGTNSHGGAFYVDGNSSEVIIRNCIIRNNTTGGYGAGIFIQQNSNKTEETAQVSKVRVENTLIAYNKSTSHCPGIYVRNTGAYFPVELTIINSTLYKNETSGCGTVWVQDAAVGSKITVINSTIAENHGDAATNAGHGIGMRFNTTAAQNMYKRIYNSIIENNISDGTASNPGDIWFDGYAQTDGENLEIRNSYIGFINWGMSSAGDNPYTGNNLQGNVLGYNFAGNSGLAWPSADYITQRNCIPLDFESTAVTGGDAQYLQAVGINTDYEGTVRPFTEGKCAVGAVESTVVAGVIAGEEHHYTHYIIYGQSLSTGHESDPLSTTNFPGNYMLGDRIWVNNGNSTLNNINPLKATTVAGPQAEAPLHGAVNHLRQLMPLQADENGMENRILATSAGTSGKPIEELSKEFQGTGSSYLYGDFQTALKKAKSASLRRASDIYCPALIFMQGEWNYQGYGKQLDGVSEPPTAAKDAYKDLYIKLKNNMQDEVMSVYQQSEKPVFYTYQVGAQYTKGNKAEIGMAQLEAANENEDIVMAGPVYPYPDVNGHLDANGYRWYGEMLGKVIYKTQVLGEKFIPLQPVKISRVAENPKQLRILFYVPKPPLVFDTNTLLEMKNYGFYLMRNNQAQTITDVEIYGNTVVLTAGVNLTGSIQVSYAGAQAALKNAFEGYNAVGHGNLRDSDDELGFFTYVRRDWTSTPIKSDHPRDTEGNVITDKPYPLYNFSVAFYYELPSGVNELIVPNTPTVPDDGIDGVSLPGSKVLQQTEGDLLLSPPQAGAVELNIYSLAGSLMSAWKQPHVAGVQRFSLKNLHPGVYIAQARICKQDYAAKIIVR